MPKVKLRLGALPYVGLEPVSGQCIDKTYDLLPSLRVSRPLTSTKLYCLVTEAHRCK